MTGRNHRRSVLYRMARLVCLVGIAGGCNLSCGDKFAVGLAVVRGLAGSGNHAKPATFDHILRIRSGKSGFGFEFRPNRELRQPFRVEASLGLPDAAHADLGADGSFGITVEDPPNFVFFTFDVKRSGDGIVVTAGGPGLATPAALTIPDALAADVAIEASGGVVTFSARRYGDSSYTPLGSATAPTARPYLMSLDASGLPKGTEIGYDLARVTANALPPSPTNVQTERETIYTALDAIGEAMYAIDGETPDRTKSGDQIDLAVTRLDAALAMDLTGFKTTRTKAASARKKAHALVAGVRGGKSANAAFKALVAIARLVGGAADKLN